MAVLEPRLPCGSIAFSAVPNKMPNRSGFRAILPHGQRLAEEEGFEPPVRLPPRLISSQVP